MSADYDPVFVLPLAAAVNAGRQNARATFACSALARLLREEGHALNRKRVQRLMRQMGIAALGPKPRTTRPAPSHKVYPYLLRDLVIDRPNQVWAVDITYIPIGRASCTWWRSWTGRAGRC